MDGDLRLGLEASLEKLYKSTLLFLLKTQLFYSRNTAGRFTSGAISVDALKDLLQDIHKNEVDVQNYESSALKQTANKQFLQTRELILLYDDRLKREKRESILNWISLIDYQSPYRDIFKRLIPGTGEWLFNREEFLQWENTRESSLLWLRGDGMLKIVIT